MNTTLEKIKKKDIIIEIFGLGYVGFPLVIKMASAGYSTIGIDKDELRIKRLSEGRVLESEANLVSNLSDLLNTKSLTFSDTSLISNKSRIAIICVPTPIPNQATPSDIFVKEAINSFLKNAKKGDVIIIESSIEIGTTDKVKNTIDIMGFTIGKDFGLAFCPERVDPKNKKWNLENIPRIIYCSDDITYQICQEIYRHVNNANLFRVNDAKTVEMIKSFENAFRLVNISLVNELAVLCDSLKINVKEVIDAAATKPFGFMPFYPGAGAGGHCIPKDPLFLLEAGKKIGIEFKTLKDSLYVNSYIPQYIAETIFSTIRENKLPSSVLVCGLSYKPDIEDMRDSPGFKVIKNLVKIGLRVSGYDPHYKQELYKKYLIENRLDKNTVFDIIPTLELKQGEFGCMCIVQHHSKSEYKLRDIYQRSLVPFIYDCQNKFDLIPESKTLLKKLGSP